MRILGTFSILVLLTLATAVLSPGKTYYVRQTGNDQNAGTRTAPWQTIGKANRTLGAGDTVIVGEGTYHEQIIPENEGGVGKPIVYFAAPGEAVVVDGVRGDLVVVRFGSNFTLEGFTIKNQSFLDFPGRVEYWVQLYGSNIILRRCRIVADGDAVDNMYVKKAASRGVVVEGRGVTIEHCYVRGQKMGIVLAGNTPRFNVLRYDTLHAHGASNLDIGSAPDNSSEIQGTLVEYCVMDTSFEEDNIQFEPNYSDRSRPYNRGTIVRNNRFGNAAENCIDLKGTELVVIDGNLLYSSRGDNDGPLDGPDDLGGSAIELGTGDITREVIVRRNIIWDNHTGATFYEGFHVYNNNFLNNRRSYRGPNTTSSEDPSFSALLAWNIPVSRRAFVNNIVVDQPNSGVFYWKMDYGDNVQLNSNLYGEVAGPVKFYHRMNDQMVMTAGLRSWQQNLASYSGYAYMIGKDSKSIEGDPKFVNVPRFPVGFDPGMDFRLAEGSLAIDAGQPVAEATNDGVNSIALSVDDPYFFCDGFGITGGDSIRIGSAPAVPIQSINYATGSITLAEPRTWGKGSGVHLRFSGAAPDIGAVEREQTSVDTTGKTLEAPTLEYPGEGMVLDPAGVGIRWQGIPSAIRYHLQLSEDQSFQNLIVNDSTLTDTLFVAGSLESGKTYHFRVRSITVTGKGPFSPPRAFSTAGQPPATPLPNEFALEQNYPNPFNPETKIRFAVPEAASVSLRVYDLIGREVMQLQEGVLPAGRYEVTVHSTGMSSGVYFYVFKAGSYVETRRMVLLR
jgi:hypothetical protein